MFIIKDIVEVGHSEFTGGSVEIGFIFDSIPNSTQKYFNIIDYVDHCLITTCEQFSKYSKRFFLLKHSKNLFEDINIIMSYFIDEHVKKISVKIDKSEFIHKPIKSDCIITFNVEG